MLKLFNGAPILKLHSWPTNMSSFVKESKHHVCIRLLYFHIFSNVLSIESSRQKSNTADPDRRFLQAAKKKRIFSW